VGCAICQTQFYVRPQFFAGQLLTEDDLQSLDDYVVAKNRLHTRYLFGSGVVCGLAVTCEPCGGGKVIVNPGYALDCCGNDIVVPCPQTLDINVMVRDLLLRMRDGYDCGDPCVSAGTTSSGQTTSSARSAAGTRSTTVASAATQGTGKTSKLSRRYCLYVDYCEQLSDPVTPYAVSDPCGHTVCEPTRVREGFRFELRCREEDDCIPEICKRLWNCIGEPTAAERTFLDSQLLRPYGSRDGQAARAIRAMPDPVISHEYWNQLTAHTNALKEALNRFKEEKADEGTQEAKLRPLLRAILELAGDVARFWVQTDPRYNEHRQDLLTATNELREACTSGISEKIDPALTTTLARVHAHALVEITRHLADESLQRLEGSETAGAPAEGARISNIVIRYLAEHVVFDDGILAAVANSLTALRDWLIVHLERQQTGTRCTLTKEVSAAPLPPPNTKVSPETAVTVSRSAGILCRAVQEALKDCFCNALNPLCPSCDDTAVLLACLTVEDCEVTEICNLERDFVITGPAIRYWIPELSRIGEALEKWCCPSREEECEEEEETTERYGESSFFRRVFGPAPAYAELALSVILEACPPLRKAGKPPKPAPTGLLAGLPMRRATGMAADAATIAGMVDSAKAEVRAELGRHREEITSLRSEIARLEERIATRPRRGGPET
jgi:hypothetical protein